MITLYDPRPDGATAAQPASQTRHRRTIPESFWIVREQRRHEYMAQKWRDAGFPAYAELCDNWAEQARLEVLALARVDERVADLDAKLAGGAA